MTKTEMDYIEEVNLLNRRISDLDLDVKDITSKFIRAISERNESTHREFATACENLRIKSECDSYKREIEKLQKKLQEYEI